MRAGKAMLRSHQGQPSVSSKSSSPGEPNARIASSASSSAEPASPAAYRGRLYRLARSISSGVKSPAALLGVVVALLIPVVLIVNGIRVATNDWYVRLEYDRLDLQHELEPLALAGLHSIQPSNREGVDLLRGLRLPDGSPAFTDRELRHMQDVRMQLGRIELAQLVALGLLAAAALVLRRRLLRALRAGAALTLGIAAVLGVYVLTGFESFFTGFHRLFFEGESWRFADSDTLIRVYPETFWIDTVRWLAAATVAQALVLLAGSWCLLRRRRSEAKASVLSP